MLTRKSEAGTAPLRRCGGREYMRQKWEKSSFLFRPVVDLTSQGLCPPSSTVGDIHGGRGACKTRHGAPRKVVRGGGGGIRKGTVLPAGIPGGSSNFPHIDDSEGTPTGGDPSRCSGCGMLPRAPHDRPSLIPLALLVAHFFLLAP